MKPNIFMSYSRRETGFVDDLTYRLEKAGFNVWLDFRRLIPGTPWAGQIDKGLRESDVVLLVVSKDSIASQFVELEWRHVLEYEHKRIILAIFEAVKLPPELKKYEWVDFRGSYEAGLKELIGQLNTPMQEMQPAPETGFKVPLIVWVTVIFAFFLALSSLYSFWTILIPLILLPLPLQVLKRNYNFSRIQSILVFQPVSLFLVVLLMFETGVFQNEAILGLSDFYYSLSPFFRFLYDAMQWMFFLSIFLPFFLLRTAGMQRWGKPEANMPKFANPYKPNNPKPKPITFFIDHVEQDSVMAKDISKGLTRYGHIPAADLKSAEAVFALVSRFKTDTEADPEKQTVFPVMVQTAQPSEKLSHVQWVDFRKGLRNIDAVAQLLPDPAKMLTALGVRPTSGTQTVMPGIISAFVNFLLGMVFLDIGSLAAYVIELWAFDGGAIMLPGILYFGMYIIAMFLIFGVIYLVNTSLTARRGWLASINGLIFSQALLFVLFYWQAAQVDNIDALYAQSGVTDPGGYFIMVPFLVYIAGGFLLSAAALFRFSDIRRWFPAKTT
ncbi:MAG TPA: toll/interleukin-1 receptor domain-containing protein [Anaerolineales bacterium]|nr:toll/interleukin-1 receptor domain-containing protein [Anaerolineales bacterium]HNC91654.1 toll/interleukin-1 receptor domain-containing protein [Anaerolineales bacterium]HNE05837.1 toll/interleukin-1 receptor domain-containing protein [Anaerolineales bacterium]HNM37261.1 toll/interleukin-1 receptor domain-containing protein [Anaerolineales bacterium]HNO94469.1 toll/interleukin-1 receptor domain-containing protein [Anaerolineales bacterium]